MAAIFCAAIQQTRLRAQTGIATIEMPSQVGLRGTISPDAGDPTRLVDGLQPPREVTSFRGGSIIACHKKDGTNLSLLNAPLADERHLRAEQIPKEEASGWTSIWIAIATIVIAMANASGTWLNALVNLANRRHPVAK